MTRSSSKGKQDLAELDYDKELYKALEKEADELDAVTKELIEESDKLYKDLAKEQEELDKGIDKWLQKEIELEDAAIKELLN